FLEQVFAREQAHPSVVENGVAFPHARTDLVDEIVIGVGRSRAGISFGENQQRAHLIFVIGVPERLLSDYLVCVGTLARLVKDEMIRSRLLNADTPHEFIEALTADKLLPRLCETRNIRLRQFTNCSKHRLYFSWRIDDTARHARI